MLMTVIVVATILVGLLGSGILYQFVGARHSARRYAPPGMMVDMEGQHLHLVCAGNGEPSVLFESGIAASSLSWARVLGDVARFRRACAYDRAGLGWSEAVTQNGLGQPVQLQPDLVNADQGLDSELGHYLRPRQRVIRAAGQRLR